MRLEMSQLAGLAPGELTALLLSAPEDQWFDRKSGRISPRELARTVVAMANAEGGLVVIGLHDGAPDRLTAGQVNGWRQAHLDFARPPVRVQAHEATGEWGQDPHTMLILEVSPSEQVVATPADEVFLRVGDEDRRLTFDQRRELLFDKGQAQFEATLVEGANEADLDPDALGAYVDAVGGSDRMRTLAARSLVGPTGAIRVAAVIGFARQPDQWLPQHVVRVIRYRGTHRLVGERQNIAADRRFSAPLDPLITSVRDAIREDLPTRRALTARGRFENVGLIPEPVWLEAVVNAVIHRSYSNAGDHIRIEIFDDALRVESPGRFPGVADLSDPMKVPRFARNPRIARLASDLRFGQELGEGLRRMFEEMRLAGLVEPQFHQTAGSVQVVLSGRQVDAHLEARLPRQARGLMQAIREQDRPSTGDLVLATGSSRPVVIKALNALVDEGLVERVGGPRNDPRAYWRIKGDHPL